MTDWNRYGSFIVWAEGLLAEVVSELTDEEFYKEMEEPQRSVHKLVAHMASSWQAYFTGQTGPEYQKLTEDAMILDRQGLMEYWYETMEKIQEKLPDEKDAKSLPWSKEGFEVSRADFNLLYMDHASYHRGQLATFLRLLGKTPVNTDYFTFVYNLSQSS